MFSKPRIAMGLALTLLATSAVQAQAGFGGWGSAHYETPAPTPESLPVQKGDAGSAATAAVTKSKPRERAAATRRPAPSKKMAVRDVPPAATPQTGAQATPAAGPIETAAPTIRDLVTKHARENGVPDRLAAAVVTIESRFNPNARGGSALGLMQIKYQTARSMGYVGGVTALLTPETNLHFGMRVLADAYKASNGDLCMTLARYQSGHRVSHVSAANRVYCTKAKSLMARAT